jgi:hypothetical protein
MTDNERELTMGEIPMLDSDRELLRAEFDDFDSMTLAEFRKAKQKRIDDILDFVNRLGGGA